MEIDCDGSPQSVRRLRLSRCVRSIESTAEVRSFEAFDQSRGAEVQRCVRSGGVFEAFVGSRGAFELEAEVRSSRSFLAALSALSTPTMLTCLPCHQ
jgi:hypothetical protein